MVVTRLKYLINLLVVFVVWTYQKTYCTAQIYIQIMLLNTISVEGSIASFRLQKEVIQVMLSSSTHLWKLMVNFTLFCFFCSHYISMPQIVTTIIEKHWLGYWPRSVLKIRKRSIRKFLGLFVKMKLGDCMHQNIVNDVKKESKVVDSSLI